MINTNKPNLLGKVPYAEYLDLVIIFVIDEELYDYS